MNDPLYLWQRTDWPQWRYDANALLDLVNQIGIAEGRLYARISSLDLDSQQKTSLEVFTDDVIKTSAIEGEVLNVQSVRSSIARRLGVDIGALAPADRHVEGVVSMTLDATQKSSAPLSLKRLLGWHAALFPTGYSDISRIDVGAFRRDELGPMQVISGEYGRHRKVHFEAPPAEDVKKMADDFLAWIDSSHPYPLPGAIKAGIGHLWFVTIHPFDDGNGRIARAIGDMLLSRTDPFQKRYYSMSAQIQSECDSYYKVLESTQKGDLDITLWLQWFLKNLQKSLNRANHLLNNTLEKSHFWQRWGQTPMNERQITMINRLFDDFEGKLTSSKWEKMMHCSQDTALRDINELVQSGALRKMGIGKATSYDLHLPEYDRRLAALPELLKTAGPAYSFGKNAAQALEDAANPDAVSWQKIELETAKECVIEHGQDAEDVIAALVEHSPGAILGRKQQEITSAVNRLQEKMANRIPSPRRKQNRL